MTRLNSLVLERVEFLPKELGPGILYVSDEYAVAGHLCACGCGSKVVVPLGPTEWRFSETAGRPTLRPSIGSWQLPCRSHYLITGGRVEWAGAWSEAAVRAGRRAEEGRRTAYYSRLDQERVWWRRLGKIVRRFFGRE